MASAYLSRTPSSNGNRKTWTFSAWCKVQKDSNETIFDVGTNGGNNYTPFFFQNDQAIRLYEVVGGSLQSYNLITNRKFRDRNAWYHLVYRVDTTQSTSSDRIRLYVNGVQETSFSTAAYPAQNYDTLKNSTSYANVLGVAADNYGANFYDGMMAHVHFCDGQSYAPTVFGETDATTGIWKPKTAPSVNYGTNGFFLRFDNSANMGLDSSGQGNNFSTNGTIIQNKDTPSNVFCTMNPLMINPSATNTFANTNNTVTINATDACVGATLGASSGKYYWEQKWTQQGANDRWGVCPDDASMSNHPRTTGIGWDTATSQFYLLGNAVSGSWGGSIGTSEIIQIALDLDNSALYLGVNGTYRNSGNPTSGSSRTGAVNFSSSSLVGKYLLPAFGKGNQDNSTMQYNFGNGYFGTTAVSSAQNPDDGIGIFEYDPPAGYRALCTKSLNAEEYS
mgnify:CR=1 FL=1